MRQPRNKAVKRTSSERKKIIVYEGLIDKVYDNKMLKKQRKYKPCVQYHVYELQRDQRKTIANEGRKNQIISYFDYWNVTVNDSDACVRFFDPYEG